MYERWTVYSGEQGQSSKFLSVQKDVAKSIGQFMLDAMGGLSSSFTGLAATPGNNLSVNIGVGALYQVRAIDPSAWSTLASDSSQWMLIGLQLASTNIIGFPAPTTAGQSINYLIEAQIQVTDSAATQTPFYNGPPPTPPVNLQKSATRQNLIVFQVKAGTAATTGTQTTPAADSGWVPLYAVTVDYGEASLTSADIVLATSAPKFYGFVQVNPLANTPVYLNPPSQQSGGLNISGTGTFGTSIVVNRQNLTFNVGGVAFFSNDAVDNAVVAAIGTTYTDPFPNNPYAIKACGGIATDTFAYKTAILYSGTHAGTDADPYPLSPINASMLGGKAASDYALAGGHYLTLYAGAPTPDPTNINGAMNGYLQVLVGTGTPPFVINSTTMVANLNVDMIHGFTPGNASGNIPISNGTKCANLNADLLDGLNSSAFQPAGNYASMNVANAGTFFATQSIVTQGGTGSSQTSINYSGSNPFGLNGGGTLSYVQAVTTALGLVASRVETSGPIYVGGFPNQNQFISGSDMWLNGMLRGGIIGYTVTAGYNGNNHPYPGNGSGMGIYSSYFGEIVVPLDTMHNSQFWIGYRTKIKFAGSQTVDFFAMGLPTMLVYVDNQLVGSTGFSLGTFISYTFSAGTHTLDLVYQAYNMNQAYYLGGEGVAASWGGALTMMGWVPQANGQVTSNILSAVPG